MFRPYLTTCGHFPFQPTRIAGAVERPAFPAPSDLFEDADFPPSLFELRRDTRKARANLRRENAESCPRAV